MGKLIKEWVKGILTEGIEQKVVVYAGRFQPFHKGHNATYEHLVKQFGRVMFTLVHLIKQIILNHHLSLKKRK